MRFSPLRLATCFIVALWVCALIISPSTLVAQETEESATPEYAFGHAVEVLESTNNQGSAYFSLAVGNNGMVYVGPAKYGVNAYLVEIDPETDEQRIVIDTHKLCGINNATGIQAQSKIHTRPFVAPSGVIYVGSKQGYPDKRSGENPWQYPGGYLMSYDPQADEAKCIAKLPYRNFGVIDVVADETRGVLYFVAQEDNYRQHLWGKYDLEKQAFELLGPPLALYAATLLDAHARAYALTKDYKLATYDPQTDEVTVRPLYLDNDLWNPIANGDAHRVPTWQIDNDGRFAYLLMMREPMLYRIDLHQATQKIQIEQLGKMVDTDQRTDSRSSLDVGPDGRVYALLRAPSPKAHPKMSLHRLVRYDPTSNEMTDLGVTAVRNPNYFNKTNPDGSNKKWPTGLVKLPDETITFRHVNQGLAVGPGGTIYSMHLVPLTVVKYEEQ